MKWNFCNTNNDSVITAGEKLTCDQTLAALWGIEDASTEIETRVAAEPVIQRLRSHAETVDYSFAKYRNAITFEILVDVYYRYLAYDLDNNLVLNETELGVATEAEQNDMEEIWMERIPSLQEFIDEHTDDFQDMWGQADRDGDLETITAVEMIDFCTRSNKLAFEHFVLENDDH